MRYKKKFKRQVSIKYFLLTLLRLVFVLIIIVNRIFKTSISDLSGSMHIKQLWYTLFLENWILKKFMEFFLKKTASF